MGQVTIDSKSIHNMIILTMIWEGPRCMMSARRTNWKRRSISLRSTSLSRPSMSSFNLSEDLVVKLGATSVRTFLICKKFISVKIVYYSLTTSKISTRSKTNLTKSSGVVCKVIWLITIATPTAQETCLKVSRVVTEEMGSTCRTNRFKMQVTKSKVKFRAIVVNRSSLRQT